MQALNARYLSGMQSSLEDIQDLNSHNDGSVQDCSNSIADAMELLQSCTEPSPSW